MVKKTKILFFLPSGVGGAERVTIIIAKMLPKDLYEVKFVVVSRFLGDIVKFIPLEYEIIQIPIRNIYCGTTFRIMQVIRQEKPDFVFSSLLYLNSRLLVAAKLCGVKAIVRNNIDLSRSLSRLNVFLVKRTYRFAYKVVAQQEEMHDEIINYTKISQSRVITLRNPIDMDSINAKISVASPFVNSESQVKYVWVARFGKEKGQDLLVQAMKNVVQNISNAHLYLVGKYNPDCQYFQSIKDFVVRNKLNDCVHFVGFDVNPYRWVKNCNCFVMPSRLEGLPNALIEAMYLNRPVVATKCIPVISRIVDHGQNGYLAEAENAESIADGMIKAIKLKDTKMTYKPSEQEDFVNLFR